MVELLPERLFLHGEIPATDRLLQRDLRLERRVGGIQAHLSRQLEQVFQLLHRLAQRPVLVLVLAGQLHDSHRPPFLHHQHVGEQVAVNLQETGLPVQVVRQLGNHISQTHTPGRDREQPIHQQVRAGLKIPPVLTAQMRRCRHRDLAEVERATPTQSRPHPGQCVVTAHISNDLLHRHFPPALLRLTKRQHQIRLRHQHLREADRQPQRNFRVAQLRLLVGQVKQRHLHQRTDELVRLNLTRQRQPVSETVAMPPGHHPHSGIERHHRLEPQLHPAARQGRQPQSAEHRTAHPLGGDNHMIRADQDGVGVRVENAASAFRGHRPVRHELPRPAVGSLVTGARLQQTVNVRRQPLRFTHPLARWLGPHRARRQHRLWRFGLNRLRAGLGC